jgi:enoyl-[acyl-carrier-protein] reductase (NADH)
MTPIEKKSSSQKRLRSKVVLLIGNDVGVLRSLAAAFSDNGADIALACFGLPAESAANIGESVRAAGGRFLLLDKEIFNNVRIAETVANKIKQELGRLDFIIDMTAFHNKKLENKTIQDSPRSGWWLSQPILQEIQYVLGDKV